MNGPELIARRQALGLSQVDLWQAWGGRNGIDLQWIKNWEGGSKAVPPFVELALAGMEAAAAAQQPGS